MPTLKRSLLWSDPRVKPPFGSVQIDWSHQLAKGLTACFVLSEGGGFPRNLATAGNPSAFDGTPRWGAGLAGLALDFPGTTDGVNLGERGIRNESGNFSVFWRGRPLADSSFHLAGSSAGTGQDSLHWGIQNGNAVVFTLAGVVDFAFTTLITGTEWFDAGISYTRGTSARASMYELETGVLARETVVDASAPTSHSEISRLGNLRGTGSFSWGGPLALTYAWLRTVSDDEFDWLHNEPFAFLVPVVRRRYFVPPAPPDAFPKMGRRVYINP